VDGWQEEKLTVAYLKERKWKINKKIKFAK
jgi:hypothetical protein